MVNKMPEPHPTGSSHVHPRGPFRGALLYFLLFFLFSILGGVTAALFTSEPVPLLTLSYLVPGVGAAIILSRIGWWKRVGFCHTGRRKDVLLYVLPVIVAMLSLFEGIAVTGLADIARFAVFSLIVAWTEEIFFRGLILQSLLPVGTHKAVIISALLFGIPHLINAVGGLWDPLFVIANTVAAFGIGITFAALIMRTGTIWPPILIHAMVNFTALLALGTILVPEQAPLELSLTIFAGVVLAGYGWFLLRDVPHTTGYPGAVS